MTLSEILCACDVKLGPAMALQYMTDREMRDGMNEV